MRDDVILSAEQIRSINQRIGAQLTERLKDEEKLPLFLCTMKGAQVFYNDLIREVKCPILLDYIRISSYVGMESTGEIELEHHFKADPTGRVVVVVEDIVDTGLSMTYLRRYLLEKYKAKEVLVVALIDKRPFRKHEVKIDYSGMVVDKPTFLMGYGMDYCEVDRNVPFLYCASEEDVKRLEADSKR